jgi:hypothetical protein
MLICDRIRGVLFVAKKNRGRRRNERRREEGRSSSHELNITNGFTDGFKSFNNFVCKNNTPSYFLFFFINYFFTIIFLIYTERIFLSVFIDRYNECIFS